MSASELHLVSFDICPYVQRAMILLSEKNAEFRTTYIDLAQKPDWFLKISPLGKVPVLQVDQTVLFESAVICEYIDETQGQLLHPEDPLVKAKHRAWMEFSSVLLGTIYGVNTATDDKDFAAKRTDLHQKLAILEEAFEGPYFGGKTFAMVDAFYAPVFRYFESFAAWGDASFLSEFPRLKSWSDLIMARPSVQSAVPADYREKLKKFLKGKDGIYSRKLLAS